MDKREENVELVLSDIFNRRYAMHGKPVLLMCGLTEACNLRCAFCGFCGFCVKQSEKERQTLPMETVREFLNLGATAKFLSPSLQGEPFLYPHFEDFIEACREQDALPVTLLTNNGTQMHKHDLSKLRGINMVQISFDSMDKKTLEILRYGVNYEHLVENIELLRRELPDTVLQMNVVVNRLNLKQLADIYSFARDKGINYITFNTVFGRPDNKVIQLLRLRESDREELSREMEEIRRRNSDGRMMVNDVTTFDGFEDGERWDYDSIYHRLLTLKESTPELPPDEGWCDSVDRVVHVANRTAGDSKTRLPYCMAPWLNLGLMPDKTVMPCCSGFGSLDTLEGKSVEEALNGKAFRELREAQFDWDMLPDVCRRCKTFARYDYINEYVDYLKKQGISNSDIEIPPHYFPNRDLIKDDELWEKINLSHTLSNTFSFREHMQSKVKDYINSKQYWEERFSSGDWDKYDGDKQTAFFVQNAIDVLPEWLRDELQKKERKLVDLGCAEGAGSALFAYNFPMCAVTGVDFSPAAVDQAKLKYPNCDFQVGDITKSIQETDIVFCSNVLEHMKDPAAVMTNMLNAARLHAILVLPYRDDLGHAEHFRRFDESFFPLMASHHHLSFFNIIDCKRKHSPYWPGKQIIVIYSDNTLFPQNAGSLSDLFINSEYEAAEHALEKAKNELELLQKELFEEKTEFARRLELLKSTESAIAMVLATCMTLLSSRIFRLAHFLSRWKYQRRSQDPAERRAFWKWLRTRFSHRVPDNDHRYNPLYQIIYPLKRQEDALGAFLNAAGRAPTAAAPVVSLTEENNPTETTQLETQKRLAISDCYCLDQLYQKYDVIVFSVIDYDFRYQRPQQIADHFAKEGHRVFYINANFVAESGVKSHWKNENLCLITLPNTQHTAVYSTDFSDVGVDLNAELDSIITREGIRDALIIADYPTWVSGICYLREKYGFALITDYMDDYTGFHDTANALVESCCITLLKNSDAITASSNYLAEIAGRFNNRVSIVRNGTEFAHFRKAFVKPTGGWTIGYYGAIAHWFDYGKIEYLSKRFPDANIVLIGAATDSEGEKMLNRLPNVRLLGEKPYRELPNYLKEFDVCLIPFDASTSLIQATNPVKFYEYLSAGKKVVATEIPELEPFRDKYVYLANDNEQFAQYVELCLSGRDELAAPEECIAFARQNDWSERVKEFSAAAKEVFPLISIIVLCYNQLDYTKQCVESILNRTAYPNYELVLVNNCSSDDTANYLRSLDAAHSNVKIVLNQTNRGFAGGNNDGIEVSDGDYIVLLNNDTVVTRGWLTDLVKRFRDESVGIVGPVTNSIGNEAMINLGYRKDVQRMPQLAYAYTAEHMGEDYPNSCTLAMFCLMFSRKLLEKVGPLDESYGIGMFEDDDYCAAAVEAGYRIVLAEDAFVHHYGSVSFKKLEDKTYRELFEKNKAYFETKWHKKWEMHRYRPGVLPEGM